MDDSLAKAVELIKIGDKASARELLRELLNRRRLEGVS
jgi:FimV-like protein